MKNTHLLVVFLCFLPITLVAQSLQGIDEIAPFSEGLAAVRQGEKWSFINEEGTLVIDFRNDVYWNNNAYTSNLDVTGVGLPMFQEGRCLISKKVEDCVPLYGFMDTKGNTIIEPQFLNLYPFKNGYTTAVLFDKTLKRPNSFENMTIMEQLKDKVVIITGRAGRIGMATAKLFLEEGAKVVLFDINKEAIENASFQSNHVNLSYYVADVSKTQDNKKYVEHPLQVHERIDIFFANTGMEGTSKPIAEYPDSIFDKVIDVNLKGVWLGCKDFIPKMLKGGSVIITSSVAGLKGFAGLGAYVANKHAVVGIMRVAALEFWYKHMRVNWIHIGPVNKDMMWRIEKDMSPDSPEQILQGFESAVTFGRYAESTEIADMALFLASDESNYITGCTHVVDGRMLTT